MGQGKPPPCQRLTSQAWCWSASSKMVPGKRLGEQQLALVLVTMTGLKRSKSQNRACPQGPWMLGALAFSQQGQRTGNLSHAVGDEGRSQEIPSLGTAASGHPPVPILPAHRKPASTIVYCSQASLPHCRRRGHAPQQARRRCQVYKLPAKSPSLLGNDASLFLCFHERTNRNLPGRVWSEVTL